MLFLLGGELIRSGQSWLAWYDSVYRYARALCHDPSLAQELVQEAYKRALAARRKPPSDKPDEIRRWLFTITRHLWQNEMRQHHHDGLKVSEYERAVQAEAETPEDILARKLLQSEIHQALDGLPAAFREVLVLREIEDLSYAEIAAILDCPAGTVMSRLARARGLLRRRLLGSVKTCGERLP